jgi:hypothetical protein
MTPALMFLGAALLFGGIGAIVVFALVWARTGSPKEPQPQPADGEVVLAGRAFRRAPTTTIAQDDYFMELLRVAGVEQPELLPGEHPQHYTERIFCDLHAKKLLAPMLSCVLTPADAPAWDEKSAPEVARFLVTLDDPQDKRVYNELLGDLLGPFCATGLPSWLRSSASGVPTPTDPLPSLAPSPALASATGEI